MTEFKGCLLTPNTIRDHWHMYIVIYIMRSNKACTVFVDDSGAAARELTEFKSYTVGSSDENPTLGQTVPQLWSLRRPLVGA